MITVYAHGGDRPGKYFWPERHGWGIRRPVGADNERGCADGRGSWPVAGQHAPVSLEYVEPPPQSAGDSAGAVTIAGRQTLC